MAPKDELTKLRDEMRLQFEKLSTKFEQLESKLDEQRNEITNLTKMLEDKDKKIAELTSEMKKLKKETQTGLHEKEIRSRNYSLRIFGMKVEGDKTEVPTVLQNVYDKLLRPILELAVEAGELPAVPDGWREVTKPTYQKMMKK